MTAMPAAFDCGGGGEVDRLALEAEVAGVALIETRDDLHERGLARTVLAHEGVDGGRGGARAVGEGHLHGTKAQGAG